MPVYDYKCKEHGIFHELATMTNAGRPAPCPQCRVPSPRVILMPPEVVGRQREKSRALERNEQARHQPVISTPDSRADARERSAQDARHGRGQSCGCGHEQSQSALSQKAIYLPDGSKVFPSQRPWMISH